MMLRQMTFRRLAVVLSAALALASCAEKPVPPPPPIHGRVVLLDSGKPSAVTVTNPGGAKELNTPGQAVAIPSPTTAPTDIKLSDADIQKGWGAAISNHPPAPVTSILYFVLDTPNLTPESRAELPKVLEVIKNRPAPEVSVIGYTDKSGEKDYNYQLGLRRAKAVAKEIEAIGVPEGQVTVDSYGSANPLIETKKQYEPRNRRVEITVR
jgi:outer membrane protein OmpA-like peptidoglycan-associated protein